MSCRPIAIHGGFLIAVLLLGAGAVSAQTGLPPRTVLAKGPRPVVGPRTYTPANFRARFHALPSAVYLRPIIADGSATCTDAQLRASSSNGVVTCAVTLTGSYVINGNGWAVEFTCTDPPAVPTPKSSWWTSPSCAYGSRHIAIPEQA